MLSKAGAPAMNCGEEFAMLFSALRALNWIALRHASVRKFKNYDHMYYPLAGYSQETSSHRGVPL
jgi:hypothetical protein